MFFIILFILFYILSNEIWVQVTHAVEQGASPSPYGTAWFSYGLHIIVLVSSIWYFGVFIGILLFLAHFFTFTHSLYGWVVMIPSIIKSSKLPDNKRIEYNNNKLLARLSMFSVIVPLYMLYTIVSFFIVEFGVGLETNIVSLNFVVFLILLALIFDYLKKYINKYSSKLLSRTQFASDFNAYSSVSYTNDTQKYIKDLRNGKEIITPLELTDLLNEYSTIDDFSEINKIAKRMYSKTKDENYLLVSNLSIVSIKQLNILEKYNYNKLDADYDSEFIKNGNLIEGILIKLQALLDE